MHSERREEQNQGEGESGRGNVTPSLTLVNTNLAPWQLWGRVSAWYYIYSWRSTVNLTQFLSGFSRLIFFLKNRRHYVEFNGEWIRGKRWGFKAWNFDARFVQWILYLFGGKLFQKGFVLREIFRSMEYSSAKEIMLSDISPGMLEITAVSKDSTNF